MPFQQFEGPSRILPRNNRLLLESNGQRLGCDISVLQDCLISLYETKSSTTNSYMRSTMTYLRTHNHLCDNVLSRPDLSKNDEQSAYQKMDDNYGAFHNLTISINEQLRQISRDISKVQNRIKEINRESFDCEEWKGYSFGYSGPDLEVTLLCLSLNTVTQT